MKRCQYKRGMKLPENGVLVARPSRWGNPARIGRSDDRMGNLVVFDSNFSSHKIHTSFLNHAHYFAVEMYRVWLDKQLVANPDFLKPLVGKDLYCYCRPDLPCHADVLIEKVKELYPEVQP